MHTVYVNVLCPILTPTDKRGGSLMFFFNKRIPAFGLTT